MTTLDGQTLMATVPRPIARTARLVLRTIARDDAADVACLAGDWQVARMLADMAHPLGESAAERWAADAANARSLAILLDGRMIGSVSVSAYDGDGAPPSAELGFWLGRPWWGFGYAREAAAAVVASLLANGHVDRLTSGHFADNSASGRVLSALGFTQTGTTQQWCLARQETLQALRYELVRAPGGS
jgi:[ribosomal protein S5]-alanine N-acetyltransferase